MAHIIRIFRRGQSGGAAGRGQPFCWTAEANTEFKDNRFVLGGGLAAAVGIIQCHLIARAAGSAAGKQAQHQHCPGHWQYGGQQGAW